MFKGIKKVVMVILFPIIFPITMLYLAKYSMVIGNIIGNNITMTTFLIPLNIYKYLHYLILLNRRRCRDHLKTNLPRPTISISLL